MAQIKIITPSNSQSTQYSFGGDHLTFIMTEGSYLTEIAAGYPAFYCDGGYLNATIAGMIVSGGNIAGMYVGFPNFQEQLGHNTVTVATSGLIQGSDGIAAFNGNNTIVNNGVIHSYSNGEFDQYNNRGAAVNCYGGNGDRIINNGEMSGFYGVYLSGSATVLNSGTLSGSSGIAARLFGATSLENHGTITGQINASGVVLTLTNFGSISGTTACDSGSITNYGQLAGVRGNNAVTIYNWGSVTGFVSVGLGSILINYEGGLIASYQVGAGETVAVNGFLTNEGRIGSATLANGDDTVTNRGSIGSLVMANGVNSLVNTGRIDNLNGGTGGDTVDNAGALGFVGLGGGTNLVINRDGASIQGALFLTDLVDTTAASTVINHGMIDAEVADLVLYPGVFFGGSGDTLINTGTIRGSVGMGAGDDVVDTALGAIIGKVDLGDGRDTYTSGDGIDRVIGGAGDDTIDLGGGDDTYRAANKDGNDTVDAGDGVDTYSAGGVSQAMTIDLSAGITARGAGSDTILGFENIVGGKGDDTLTGDDGRNRIDGGTGADVIQGGDGGDRLIGGTGTDTIFGGAGRDVMAGGADADLFVYRSAGDSGTTSATRDVITDFTDHGSATAPYAKGADTIDLSAIDANNGASGNQAFTFNETEGAAFSGVAGSLIWQQLGGYALVSGDTNGDKIADFVIQLNGTHLLFASDFVL